MVSEVQLDDTNIHVIDYEASHNKNKTCISITFNVTSDEYHDIATLLYKESFDVKVPEADLEFRGVIKNYSTSFVNLYEAGQVSEYQLTLEEIEQ